MDFTLDRNTRIAAFLLLALAVTQPLYTLLYVQGADVSRDPIWGLEGVLFTLLAAFAGAALVQAKQSVLGFSALAFSAVLNLVQVSIGLTLFAPFGGVAAEVEGLAPAAGGVVAFSFMVYYAAKLLLGLAALEFGLARLNAGSKLVGGAAAIAGAAAMLANTILIVVGRDGFLPSAVAGASGVLATLLLALCLLGVARDQS